LGKATMNGGRTLKGWIIVGTLGAALLAGGCRSMRTAGSKAEDPDARAQVERRLHEVLDAAERKDFDRLESFHLYGPKFTRFSGSSATRQDAAGTRKLEREGLAALDGLEMRAEDLKVDLFGNVAIATFILDCSFDTQGGTVRRRDRCTLVFVRENGVWRIVHEHLSSIAPADPGRSQTGSASTAAGSRP
jgi:ketosteroid isomerase-like protein